jgi:four helix bundle protein
VSDDLVRQIRWASVSVFSNFTEVFDREGTQEFVQYLTYSKGSIGEMRGQLMYAVDEEMLEEQKRLELDQVARRAIRLIGGLITYLNSGKHRGASTLVSKTTRILRRRRMSLPVTAPQGRKNGGRLTVDGRRLTDNRLGRLWRQGRLAPHVNSLVWPIGLHEAVLHVHDG